MNKGQFMELVYTEDELRNINNGLPSEYYDGRDPSIKVDTFCHVMNFNKPNEVFGRLENMFEVADQRGIEVPLPITPEEMSVICNIQGFNEVIEHRPTPLWALRHLTLDQLRAEQERLIPLYNEALKYKDNGEVHS